MALMTKLTAQEIADQAPSGWVKLLDGLQTRMRTKNFATGLSMVDAIGAAAEEMDHHPDLDLRYGHLDVRLTSHDTHGVTDRDIRLARTISAIAAAAGVELECGTVSRLELALDSPDFAAVRPFWRAVLAMDGGSAPGVEDELNDRFGVLPTIWFQPSGVAEPRQRWHLDLWVDPDAVQGRIDAALASGGTLVSDTAAPSFWVLADSEGNRVCVCTWQDRPG